MGPGKVRSNTGVIAGSVELVLPGQAHIIRNKIYLKGDDQQQLNAELYTKQIGYVTMKVDDYDQVSHLFPSC